MNLRFVMEVLQEPGSVLDYVPFTFQSPNPNPNPNYNAQLQHYKIYLPNRFTCTMYNMYNIP